LFRKSTKVAKFHKLRLDRIDLGESFQRLIQRQQFIWLGFGNRPGVP